VGEVLALAHQLEGDQTTRLVIARTVYDAATARAEAAEHGESARALKGFLNPTHLVVLTRPCLVAKP
jgi:hypothetical protein